MSKDDEPKREPLVEQVVDLLLNTERIMERYHERKRQTSGDAFVEEPGLAEVMLLAQIINQTQMATAMGVGSQGGGFESMIVDKLSALRDNILKEVKAYVDSLERTVPLGDAVSVPSQVPPPTPAELVQLNKALERVGAPDYETLRIMSPTEAEQELLTFRRYQQSSPLGDLEAAVRAGVTMPVKLDRDSTHERFEDLLFTNKVDLPAAKKTLELLLTTPSGNEMLKLMLYDAVGIMKKRQAAERAARKPPQGG